MNSPSDPNRNSLLATGKDLMRAGQLAEAEQKFNRILARVPHDPDTLHLLGLIRFQAGNHEEAVNYIKKAIAHAQPNEDYLHNLGQIYNMTAEFAHASECFRQALDINPDYPDAHLNLGTALQGLGQLDDAVASYEKALAIKPDYLEAHVNLGNAFIVQGRPDDAVATFHKALAIKPDSAVTHSNLGNALKDLGRLDDAVASYEEALAIKPDYPEALVNLGTALQELERPDDAVASYRKALSIKPDFPEAHYNLGLALKEIGRLEDAAASFQEALALDPDFALAHGDLGHVFKDLGRLEEAEKSYRCALQIDPGLNDVRHFKSAVAGETTEIPPDGYVRESFDDYAKRFDDHLTNTLGYEIPTLMRQAVDHITGSNAKFRRALDLGCGTGLVGQEFGDIVEQLHGNDLSPEMIKIAEQKEIYDEIYLADALEFLERPENQQTGYDIVLAADFFIYIGNLAPIFAAVREVMTAGGLFVFSVESLDKGTSKLLLSGRYSQSEAYIRNLASDGDFSVELCNQVIVRTERGDPIPGNVFILKKAL